MRGVKRRLFCLCSILAFFGAAMLLPVPVSVAGEKAGLERPYVPGELLVKYRTSRNAFSTQDRGRPNRWRRGVLRRFKDATVDRVRVRDGLSVEQALALCRSDPDVAYAEPNYLRSVYATTPDDPRLGELWGLEKIRAEAAWDIQTGNKAVIVAVLDSGIDLDHEDWDGNLWENSGETAGDGVDDDGNGYNDDVYGWDFVNQDNMPDDDRGHGSHVSGTIGAVGDNGIGVVGVNWSVSLMPLKIIGSDGYGTVDHEIEAIDYAIENGAHVINASFGGDFFSQLEYDAIKAARNAGILFVASAGNDDGANNDTVPHYPSSYALGNIISVAATNQADALASFSNKGPLTVHVAAPGVSILSTLPNDQYDEYNGTSMAAPHVTGLAALIWANDVAQDGVFDLSFDEVRDRIFNGVDVLPRLSGSILMAGRINAYQSLVALDGSQIPVRLDNTGLLGTTVFSYDAVELSWIYTGTGQSGFKIYRGAASGGPYDHVGTADDSSDRFTDTTAPDNRTSFYRVTAFNEHGESDYSIHEASATVPFAPPGGLLAFAFTEGSIDLYWSDNSVSESGYSIEEGVGTGVFSVVTNVGANTQSYTRTGLAASTTYTYRVRAFDGSVFSDYSNEASATTLTPVITNDGGGGGGGGGGCFIGTIAF